MPDYAKGKIYRVVNTDDKTVYIGSTCQTLSQRFTRHNHKGNGNRIILIEDYPCENKEHRENQREYREANRDKIIEQEKKYYEANRDKILEYHKEYREANRDKIREYHKEYNDTNRKQIQARKAEKIVCEHCGSEVSRRHLVRHKRSAKCKAYQITSSGNGNTRYRKPQLCFPLSIFIVSNKDDYY